MRNPIIKKAKKIEPKQVSFKIDAKLAAELSRYSRYTNVPVWEIVSCALRHVIDSDKEFTAPEAVEKKAGRKSEVHEVAA